MGAPSDPAGEPAGAPGAPSGGGNETPFDPYRYGAPDVPPPPEYAPPGYVPPAGYQAPGAPEQPHGPYPPYPYGTTAGRGYDRPPAPYGQSPYGPPPGYPYGPPTGQQPPQGGGKAVAALVLGIISIVLFWTTIIDGLFVVLAVIFGVLGLGEAKARGRGRGQALAGIICAVVGAVLAIAFTVFVVHAANKCGGLDQQGSDGFQQCLNDQF